MLVDNMLMKLFDSARLFLSLECILSTTPPAQDRCDHPQHGYQCETDITHFLGHYSPYFSVPSDISPDVPDQCDLTFVQALSRHGARYPTSNRWGSYKQTIDQIQANVTTFTDHYSFLSDYGFALGEEQLTAYGEQEMFNSGLQFASRYHQFISDNDHPFVRSSSGDRVVRSAEKWIQGYQQQLGDATSIPILLIRESHDSNNTLTHGRCTNFEEGPISEIVGDAKAEFAASFVPDIRERLNEDLPGADLTIPQIIDLMDLCSYETVASPNGDSVSPFCHLFSKDEWHMYNYYQTLDKYYGRGLGNELGPTQGVGFVNELLARMTATPVVDHTSSNHTLDSNPDTFPLDRNLYADFSHDNDMTSIFFAMGLYNDTEPLSKETSSEADSDESQGYSASWTVPFAARAYFEKMRCIGETEELVRAIVNGRVVPLVGCGADVRGMCTLSDFVESQSFARSDGHWDECFS